MSFNILHAVVSGAESFLTSGGNPIAAGIGAIAGGCEQNQTPSATPGLDPNALLQEMLGERQSVAAHVNALGNRSTDFSIIGGDN